MTETGVYGEEQFTRALRDALTRAQDELAALIVRKQALLELHETAVVQRQVAEERDVGEEEVNVVVKRYANRLRELQHELEEQRRIIDKIEELNRRGPHGRPPQWFLEAASRYWR